LADRDSGAEGLSRLAGEAGAGLGRRLGPGRGDATALTLLTPAHWRDYELVDSGDGAKLERFGPYLFARPEPQALWRPLLPVGAWEGADATFRAGGDEESGRWVYRRPIEQRWPMAYGDLRFWAQATPFRHLGVFPEQASHWDWTGELIGAAGGAPRVLNLFGYTGLASLAAAAAGAAVTHVDASKKAIAWARENQSLSGLEERPIRWIVDDALKFVRREARRGARYDGLILDPPKFGRGPQGEVWKLEESLGALLADCRAVLAERPLFVVLTAYAIRASALSLSHLLRETMAGWGGVVTAGEMTLAERSGGRQLSTAIFAAWSATASA